MLYLEVKVVFVGLGTKLHLLDLDHGALAALLTLLFGRFVFEATIVHDLADGRHSLRGDLDEVESLFAGEAKCIRGFQNADLLTVATDHTDARNADAVVDSILLGGRGAAFVSQGRGSES